MRPQPPPDPSQGLFETILVADGRPIESAAHLERLSASARELFGVELSPAVASDARRAAAGMDLGRLRVEVAPDGAGGLRHSVTAAPIDRAGFFPTWERGEALRSVVVEGRSGTHKWSDRRWLEATEAALGDEVPLLVDADDNVLEAGRANLFLVVDGRLATPPTDGRILPGTTRAATLAIATELGIEVSERSVSIAELRAVDEVFLTSSTKGLRPARYLDGVELDKRGDLTERLAAELRERWLASSTQG